LAAPLAVEPQVAEVPGAPTERVMLFCARFAVLTPNLFQLIFVHLLL